MGGWIGRRNKLAIDDETDRTSFYHCLHVDISEMVYIEQTSPQSGIIYRNNSVASLHSCMYQRLSEEQSFFFLSSFRSQHKLLFAS